MTNTHKITNKKTGQAWEGRIIPRVAEGDITFHIELEGAVNETEFFYRDWDIESLNPPLPTTPGYYTSTAGGAIYELEKSGWTLVGVQVPTGKMREIARVPLVRLVPETTEITDEMLAAYSEAYEGHAGDLAASRRAGLLAAIKVGQASSPRSRSGRPPRRDQGRTGGTYPQHEGGRLP